MDNLAEHGGHHLTIPGIVSRKMRPLPVQTRILQNEERDQIWSVVRAQALRQKRERGFELPDQPVQSPAVSSMQRVEPHTCGPFPQQLFQILSDCFDSAIVRLQFNVRHRLAVGSEHGQVDSGADRRLAFLLVRLAGRRLHRKAIASIDGQVLHEEELGFLLTNSERAITFAWKDQAILAGLLLRRIYLGEVRADLVQETFKVMIEVRHFRGIDRQAREKSRRVSSPEPC